MASAPEAVAAGASEEATAPSGGKRKLILLAVPVLLGGIGAGLWFSGIVPKLLGAGADADGPAAEAKVKPVFVELPEIVANLNSGGRRTSYVKLKAQLEVGSTADAALVQTAMPRVLDMFQTYIREMRPEELRNSGGTYRLREELLARANITAAPARIRDVLFVEVLIQ